MGNVCKSIRAQERRRSNALAKAPRSLDQLLTTLNFSNLEDPTDYNLLLSHHNWAQKFQDYLKSKDLEDDLLSLKFVAAITQLEYLHNKMAKSKAKARLEADCSKLLRMILHDFFDVEHGHVLTMSNATVQESIMEMDVDEKFSKEKLNLLQRAKTDATVWHEGLEPRYAKFLAASAASGPSVIVACLLSIL